MEMRLQRCGRLTPWKVCLRFLQFAQKCLETSLEKLMDEKKTFALNDTYRALVAEQKRIKEWAEGNPCANQPMVEEVLRCLKIAELCSLELVHRDE